MAPSRASGVRSGIAIAAVLLASLIAVSAVPVASQSPAASRSPAPAAPSTSPLPSDLGERPSPDLPRPARSASIDLDTPLSGPGVLPTDQASVDLVAAIRTDRFGPNSLLAAKQALASVGIAVVDGASGETVVPIAGAPSPLRFLDWQAHAMAVEAWAGGGVSGADLDAVTPVPDDVPLTSSLLAGWIAVADTPAGRLARALLAGQDVTDPTTLLVPSMVLALFAADLAADEPSALARAVGPARPVRGDSVSSGLALAAWRPADARTAAGICTGAQQFIDNVIDTVFDALHARPPESGAGRVIVSVWDWLVDRGRDFVRSLAKELTTTAIGAIRLVAGTLATVAHVVAAIVPYTVVVVPVPVAEVAIPPDPGPPIEGAFYVIVSAGDLPDWPDVLRDCAQAAGATLPSFKPAGNPITWGGLEGAEGLLVLDSSDTVLDERGAGALRFRTVTEPPEVAQGDPHVREVRLAATIRRRDAEEQAARLKDDLFGNVPGIIRPFVAQALRPLVDGLMERVTRLLEAKGRGSLSVIYHTPRPTPSPSPTPTPATAVWVHHDRPASPGLQAGRVFELVACRGSDGPWKGLMRAGGLEADGAVIIAFKKLPVGFTPRNGHGRDDVRTTLPYGPLSIKARWQLRFRIDGSTMTISGKGSALGPGGVVNVAGLDIPPLTLPIEPAPAGKCSA